MVGFFWKTGKAILQSPCGYDNWQLLIDCLDSCKHMYRPDCEIIIIGYKKLLYLLYTKINNFFGKKKWSG